MKLSNKKIAQGATTINDDNWPQYFKKLALYNNKYSANVSIPATLHNSSMSDVKEAINELYNFVSAINAKEQSDYDSKTMRN